MNGLGIHAQNIFRELGSIHYKMTLLYRRPEVWHLDVSHASSGTAYPLFPDKRSLRPWPRSLNPARKRKAPTKLLISGESKAALRARLDSEEGLRCLAEFAKLLAESAAKMMPTEILDALDTDEGHQVIDELWPDVVHAYFKARCNPAPRK
jgi:hypothetical protein